MAVAGAPTGRKVSGASRSAAKAGGRLSGAIGTRRTKLPLKGGHPSGPHAHLVAGTKKGDS
jgi:hypothetical protein